MHSQYRWFDINYIVSFSVELWNFNKIMNRDIRMLADVFWNRNEKVAASVATDKIRKSFYNTYVYVMAFYKWKCMFNIWWYKLYIHVCIYRFCHCNNTLNSFACIIRLDLFWREFFELFLVNALSSLYLLCLFACMSAVLNINIDYDAEYCAQ